MLLCPQCQSSQLTALDQGTTNPLLERGIQLFAGTIKSNKIVLICRSCSHSFKPGESKTGETIESYKVGKVAEDIDSLIVGTVKDKGFLATIRTYKALTGVTLAEAKKKVETVATAKGIKPEAKTPVGCYIILCMIILLGLGVIIGIVKAFK